MNIIRCYFPILYKSCLRVVSLFFYMSTEHHRWDDWEGGSGPSLSFSPSSDTAASSIFGPTDSLWSMLTAVASSCVDVAVDER